MTWMPNYGRQICRLAHQLTPTRPSSWLHTTVISFSPPGGPSSSAVTLMDSSLPWSSSLALQSRVIWIKSSSCLRKNVWSPSGSSSEFRKRQPVERSRPRLREKSGSSLTVYCFLQGNQENLRSKTVKVIKVSKCSYERLCPGEKN